MADPPRGPILLTADWGQRGGQRARHGVHGRNRVGLGPQPRGLTHGLEGGAVILGVGCTGGIDPHCTPDLGTAGRGAGGNSMIGAVLVGGRPHTIPEILGTGSGCARWVYWERVWCLDGIGTLGLRILETE